MRLNPTLFPLSNISKTTGLLALGCGWLIASASAMAGTTEDKNVVEQPAPVPLDTLVLDESYVFASQVKFANQSIGYQTENRGVVEYVRRFEINGPWHFDLGVHYDDFNFGGANPPALLPGSLQNISMPIGVSYMVDDHAGFQFHLNPGVYFEHHINSGAFDIPVDAGTYIPLKKDVLYWVVGLGTSDLRQYHVIPTVGLIWVINKDWQLMGYLPEPKLVYNVSENLTTWIGGEVIGESFKTDQNNFATPGGKGTTSGGVVDYTEIRAGLGVTYTPIKRWDISLVAGYSLVRDFDFYRADKDYQSDPAPYARVVLNASF